MSELKPCPFCGTADPYTDNEGYVNCQNMDGCGAVVNSPTFWNTRAAQITPQAGAAEPVATLHADGYWVLNKKHPNYTDIQYQSERGNWRLPVYRTAPPPPVCPHPSVGLIHALMCQKQCDEDGVEVRVSRQALDEAIEILRALPPSPVGPVWQSIETAPRDGTRCLYYSPGRKGAGNLNARYPYCKVDAFSEQWPNAMHQLPEAPYTVWQPLPSPPDSPGATEES